MNKCYFKNACLIALVLFSNQSIGEDLTSKSPQAAVPEATASNSISAATFSRPVFKPTQNEYVIGYQDLIEIQVFQADSFSRTVRVNSQGIISLPLVGSIQAGGLTSQELEVVIVAKLSESYMQDPQVSVFIKEYTSQRVTIEGFVKTPGIYPLKGKTTLMQAVAMAAGLDSLADAAEIRVFRNINGEMVSRLYNLEVIRSGQAEDPIVMGDDVIVVEKSAGKSLLKNFTDTLRGFITFGTL